MTVLPLDWMLQLVITLNSFSWSWATEMLLNVGHTESRSIKCVCIQSRFKMMEVYSKQSLKTTQQHVSSLMTQLTKYRLVSISLVLFLNRICQSFPRQCRTDHYKHFPAPKNNANISSACFLWEMWSAAVPAFVKLGAKVVYVWYLSRLLSIYQQTLFCRHWDAAQCLQNRV